MPAPDCEDKNWASLDLSRDLLKDKREREREKISETKFKDKIGGGLFSRKQMADCQMMI